MDKLNVTVEHIFHSGFTVETENFYLIFDYYKGDISLKNKKTIVFSTHSHGDHFNPLILGWKDMKENISYILSSDIDVEKKDEKIHIMEPYEELELNNIKIKTFGSTDMGVSFLVNVDNINIFHAGDLNWWYWEEDTKKEKVDMEKAFKEEISKIKDFNVDIAFFPVDPRLGNAFSLGGEYFIKEVNPKYFIPMHFGDKFNTTKEFIHKMKGSTCEFVELNRKNQIMSL